MERVPSRDMWQEWLSHPCTKGLVGHFNNREGYFRALLGTGWCMTKVSSLEEIAKRYIEGAAVANEYMMLQEITYDDVFPQEESDGERDKESV